MSWTTLLLPGVATLSAQGQSLEAWGGSTGRSMITVWQENKFRVFWFPVWMLDGCKFLVSFLRAKFPHRFQTPCGAHRHHFIISQAADHQRLGHSEHWLRGCGAQGARDKGMDGPRSGCKMSQPPCFLLGRSLKSTSTHLSAFSRHSRQLHQRLLPQRHLCRRRLVVPSSAERCIFHYFSASNLNARGTCMKPGNAIHIVPFLKPHLFLFCISWVWIVQYDIASPESGFIHHQSLIPPPICLTSAESKWGAAPPEVVAQLCAMGFDRPKVEEVWIRSLECVGLVVVGSWESPRLSHFTWQVMKTGECLLRSSFDSLLHWNGRPLLRPSTTLTAQWTTFSTVPISGRVSHVSHVGCTGRITVEAFQPVPQQVLAVGQWDHWGSRAC